MNPLQSTTASVQDLGRSQRDNLLAIHGLQQKNRRRKDYGGISQENRSYGFRPGFLDTHTGTVYLSRFADGRVAPMHLLDGLPPELTVQSTPSVKALKESVTAGFIYRNCFYTREQAAQAVQQQQANEMHDAMNSGWAA